MSNVDDGNDTVEFGPLRTALLELEYPISTTVLIEQFGGFEFERPGGTVLLEELLQETDRRHFETPETVRDLVVEALADAEDAETLTAAPNDWSR